jgi:hypothetical protein
VLGSDGTVRLRNLAPWFVEALSDVLNHLQPDPPEEVRQRIYQDPTDEEELNKQWRRLMHPEIKALIAGAREIVEHDLASLRPLDDGHGFLWEIEFQRGHLHGWISAINTARLALGSLWGVDADEMEREPGDLADEREEAIWRIHFLGWIQALLIENAGLR